MQPREYTFPGTCKSLPSCPEVCISGVGPAPDHAPPWRPWTLTFLFFACLIPRAVAAWNWDVLWSDSLHYLHASLALERGDFDVGFLEFGLNLYTLVLIPLRHLGIEWQIAGKYFGVVVASLAVLPLWGWLRRMFDYRTATLASLVYALHGKLIAISPLIIRDSTFWFLLVLSLYCLWRAIGELRLGFFLAAGVTITLAIFTRTEGWLLLIPLVGWGACRWPSAKGKRLGLMIRCALCIAVVPAAVALLNFTWLRDHPRWDFFRPSHVRLALRWWNGASGIPGPDRPIVPPAPAAPIGSPSPVAAPLAAATLPVKKAGVEPHATSLSPIYVPTAAPPEQSMPGWVLTFKFMERVAKACTWIGCLLLLVGLARAWRIFLRPEHLVLCGMNLSLLLISRIRYATVVGLDFRYFMPLVIIAVPWMALGLEKLIGDALWLLRKVKGDSRRASRVLVGGLVAVSVACSLLDGPMPASADMRKHADLGRWIINRLGPDRAIAGNVDHFSIEVFYSHGQVIGTFSPGECMLVPMPAELADRKADVVVLWTDRSITPEYREIITPEHREVIVERLTQYCGYRRVDAAELPADEKELLVFVRRDEAENTAAEPNPDRQLWARANAGPRLLSQ